MLALLDRLTVTDWILLAIATLLLWILSELMAIKGILKIFKQSDEP